jgi:1-deoxy-D-xylulose-5-phosphate reductoisomerase
VADDAFIKGQIPFLAMADLIEAVLSKVEPVSPLSYETIVEADRKAREVARTLLSSMGEV